MVKGKRAHHGVDNSTFDDSNADEGQVTIEIPQKDDRRKKDKASHQELEEESDPVDDIEEEIDLSIVPAEAILRREDVEPLDRLSHVKITRKQRGINSYDPRLTYDVDELWRYFLTYLDEKPNLFVSIKGSHKETTKHTTIYRDNYGGKRKEKSYSSRIVEDFDIDVDMSPYIAPTWDYVAIIQRKSKNPDKIITLRDILQEFGTSTNVFKKIVCQKQLAGWNYKQLKKQIKQTIHGAGYGGNISIKMSQGSYQITAKSSSTLNCLAHTKALRWFSYLVFNALCVLFIPCYCCVRQAGRTSKPLVAQYSMTQPIQNFLHYNHWHIVEATRRRQRVSLTAAFR